MSRRRRSPGFDRPHRAPGRERQIKVRFSDEEFDPIAAAAAGSGLTMSGFVAEAALAAARGGVGSGQQREALRELIAARTQLRRYGNNVNQAVRALHSIGQPPPWLLDAIRLTDQAVLRIDQAADRLTHPPGAATPQPTTADGPNSRPPSPVPPDKVSGGLR